MEYAWELDVVYMERKLQAGHKALNALVAASSKTTKTEFPFDNLPILGRVFDVAHCI